MEFKLVYRSFLKPLLRISGIAVIPFILIFAAFGLAEPNFGGVFLFFSVLASISLLVFAATGKYLLTALALIISLFVLINLSDDIRRKESATFCQKLVLEECPLGAENLRMCPESGRKKIKEFHCFGAITQK
jgi:hypothetical protein